MAEVLEMDFDLNGLYHVKVDAKGRMPLPAQLRNALPENLVDFKVTVSPEGDCLYLFSSEGFNRWVRQAFENRFGKADGTSLLERKLRSKLKSRVRDVSLDSAGRIMLSPDQREKAGIEKDVCVIGNEGYIEIWDEDRRTAFDEDVDLSILFG